MNMPGFTAEASISKSSEHYQLTADKTRFLKTTEVVPQRMVVYNGCIYECDWVRRCKLYGCYA